MVEYAYIERHYGKTFVKGQRVYFEPYKTGGTVLRKDKTVDNYVHVQLDGFKHTSFCHPGELTILSEAVKMAEGKWRVHTARLFAEIIENNPTMAVMKQPLLIMDGLLREVALRASALNDPKLNALMAQLTLYDIADPESPNYDKDKMHELIYCNGLQQ